MLPSPTYLLPPTPFRSHTSIFISSSVPYSFPSNSHSWLFSCTSNRPTYIYLIKLLNLYLKRCFVALDGKCQKLQCSAYEIEEITIVQHNNFMAGQGPNMAKLYLITFKRANC